MWTAENRARYDRDKLRYPSDLTDREWAYVELSLPFIPSALMTEGSYMSWPYAYA